MTQQTNTRLLVLERTRNILLMTTNLSDQETEVEQADGTSIVATTKQRSYTLAIRDSGLPNCGKGKPNEGTPTRQSQRIRVSKRTGWVVIV